MVAKIKNGKESSASVIGGKASNLYKLKEKGFRVPEFISIPHTLLVKGYLNNSQKIIKDFINPKKEYIIRSSAIGEDGSKYSFAGMFDSVRIKNNKDFSSELKQVISSQNSKRVISYLKSREIKTNPKLSIIVQEYIKGEVSGVMFSTVKQDGKKGVLINSNKGSAKSVVDGADSDSYFVASKNSKSKGKSLTTKNLKKLVKTAKEIEKKFGAAQDIEWTIKGNKIYLLQSRPITSELSTEVLVWDNSNIAESYSGIVLPLTSSYIKYAYEETYVDLAKRSGVSQRKINEYRDLFENLLGVFYGRVYYNMLNWYKMLTLYPGYERNKENLDTMISAKSKEELDEEYRKNVSKIFKIKYYSKLFLRYPFFNSEVKKFKRYVRKCLNDFNKMKLKTYGEVGLLRVYQKSAKDLLSKWSITVESDFLLMTYFGLLKKFCKKHNLEDQFVYLISNINEVMSAKQVDKLRSLSDEFFKHKELENLARKQEYAKALGKIRNEDRYSSLSNQIFEYHKSYGGRFINELKLETENLDSNADYLIALLCSYKKSKPQEVKVHDNKLSNNLSYLKKQSLKFILARIKFYARQREELRLLRAQSFNIAREIFLEIGTRFKSRGIIDSKKDIFYLEVDEIAEIIESKKSSFTPSTIIGQRKKEYKKFESVDLEDVFYTYGYDIKSKFTKKEKSGKQLLGQGCSPGIVKGKVRILDQFSPAKKEDYEIIVTKHTDPGWTPLFGLCKGIIVEHGGLLSHAAIISRELGLPCIIGLKDATKKFKDGQTITINGYTGEVKIHDKN